MLPIADLNPTRSAPYATYTLLAVNVVVFLSSRGSGWMVDPEISLNWGLVPARLMSDPAAEAARLFGHAFVHEELGHLAGNLFKKFVNSVLFITEGAGFKLLLLYVDRRYSHD